MIFFLPHFTSKNGAWKCETWACVGFGPTVALAWESFKRDYDAWVALHEHLKVSGIDTSRLASVEKTRAGRYWRCV